jgi:hypothetical protein
MLSYKLSITTPDFFIFFIDLKKGTLRPTRQKIKIKTPGKLCVPIAIGIAPWRACLPVYLPEAGRLA